MIVEVGDKVHIIYRALYEKSTRRHFLGEIVAADRALCRIEGFAFVYDQKTESYVKKLGKRTTIVDLGESGYIVNMIASDVNLDSVFYRYQSEMGLVATDGKNFLLDINEFGLKN